MLCAGQFVANKGPAAQFSVAEALRLLPPLAMFAHRPTQGVSVEELYPRGYLVAWVAAVASSACRRSVPSRNRIAPMSQGPIRRCPIWSFLGHTAVLPASMA